MSEIKVMDSALSNMIAAGEVVERPANVVKELLENSIDAGASHIEIKIKDAGRSLIRIKDDGKGMSKEDAKTSFLRHATSKISTKQDLFHIKTLGFRGEALPSIASISHVTMETSNGIEGTKLVIENDKLISVEDAPLRKGTTIEVTKLFYTTPARLKFLKSDNTEYSNILDIISKEALANPNISFTLLNDTDKIILKTSGRGNPLEVIKDVYGFETAQNMLPITLNNNDFNVTGYIGKFILSKSNRNYIIFIVNGRVVKIPMLQSVVCEAYANYIPTGRYPFVVLYIKADASLIDVNVHPSKNEIRMEKNDKLIEMLKTGIRSTLTNTTMIPEATITRHEIKLQPQLNLDGGFVLSEDVPEEKQITQTIEQKFVEATNEPLNKPIKNNLIQMTPIGQIHGTYILAESKDGFYIIDQHAAMERINFEKFSKVLLDDNHQSDLLVPSVVEFSLNVINSIKDHLDALESVGIKAEIFGNNALKVNSIPEWMKDIDVHSYVSDMVEQVINSKTINLLALRNHAIATLACKASLKANKRLSIDEMQNLITRLLQCENPHTCPHGRPTMIFYATYDLEKMFKRVM